jgi:hypothetical protein
MMRYLPIFEPGRVRFVGAATVRYADIMLNKRAIFLSASGDSVVFQAHGRQVGLVFFRHPWSGRVIVKINGTVHEAELYSAESRHWVCEFDLPPSGLATIRVESLAAGSQAAQGTEVWLEAVYVSDYRTCEVPELIAQRVAASPLAGLQLNQLTDVFKWYDIPGAMRWHGWHAPPIMFRLILSIAKRGNGRSASMGWKCWAPFDPIIALWASVWVGSLSLTSLRTLWITLLLPISIL